ncbi:MAG: hypothetical protein RIC87_11150 [Kiloniellales bacterium]
MLLRSLAALAARRLAADPRVREKARDFAANQAMPVVERKTRAVQSVVKKAEPGTHPARIAGRAVRKLIDG